MWYLQSPFLVAVNHSGWPYERTPLQDAVPKESLPQAAFLCVGVTRSRTETIMTFRTLVGISSDIGVHNRYNALGVRRKGKPSNLAKHPLIWMVKYRITIVRHIKKIKRSSSRISVSYWENLCSIVGLNTCSPNFFFFWLFWYLLVRYEILPYNTLKST